jgi:hypothetical protein
LEFNLPLRKWRELLGNRVRLAGGLEVTYRPCSDVPAREVTTEDAAGAAVAVLSSGADFVYLFNYFQQGHPAWPLADYQRVLNACSSLEKLTSLPRRHAVTGRDVVVPGAAYRPPLPAEGMQLSFELPVGPVPPPNWRAEATIEVAAPRANGSRPMLLVNGIAGELHADQATPNGNRLLTYVIALAALTGRDQENVAITAAGPTPIRVLRVELNLRPAE